MQSYNNSFLINFKSDSAQVKTTDAKSCTARSVQEENSPVQYVIQYKMPDYMKDLSLNNDNTYIMQPEEIYKIQNNIAANKLNTETEYKDVKKPPKLFSMFNNTSKTGEKILKFFGIQPKGKTDENISIPKPVEETVDYAETKIDAETVLKEALQRGITRLNITDENAVLLHKLLQAKDKGNNRRFHSWEIIDLSENKELDTEVAIKLIDLTNADKKPRFVSWDIKKLANKNLNSDLVMKLIEITDDNGCPLFDTNNIVTLSQKELNPDMVMKLISMVDKKGNPLFDPSMTAILSGPNYNQELVVKLAGMTDIEGKPRFDKWSVAELSDKNLNSKTVSKLVDMVDEKGYPKFTSWAIQTLSSGQFNHDRVMNFVQIFKKITNPYEITMLMKNENEIFKFFADESYMTELKQHSAGKYQNEVMDFLNPANMLFGQLSLILDSKLSKSDYLKSVEKLSKSTFKLAYETPNRYLSNINSIYTIPVNGKLPKLPEKELRLERQEIKDFFKYNAGLILKALNYTDTDTINHMMDKRTTKFTKSLEELNAMTDDNLKLLSKLIHCKSETTGKALSPKEKIQTCQIMEIFDTSNIDTSELENCAQNGVINFEIPKRIILNSILKTAGVDLNDPNIIDDNTKFNEEFSYLILKDRTDGAETYFDNYRAEYNVLLDGYRINSKARQSAINLERLRLTSQKDNITPAQRQALKEYIEMLNNIESYTNDQIFNKIVESMCASSAEKAGKDELFTIIQKTVTGDFNKFITDESNIYGQTNKKTEQIFKNKGLNYDKWMNPDIEDIELNVGGKKMTIKLWDRNPLEDLFIGNKTTCCTAIGTGGNAEATPSYLLNTSFNVVELYDSNDNAVGMSRVFMGKLGNKPTLIMDNIELNKTYVNHMTNKQKKEIRDGFFDYMNKYAKQVTGDKNAQVRFYADDIHVPKDDLKYESKPVDFIGAFTSKSKEGENFVYINSFHCSWINPANLGKSGNLDLLIVPKK